MINLLPPEEKQAIAYARYNTQLRRWIAGACIGLAGVFVVVMAGQFYLKQNADTYRASIEASRQNLHDQRQGETLTRVKDIQDSLKLVVDVLSREILFSKLLVQVAKLMPEGTVLEGISLSTESSADNAFDLTALAENYQSASQIQINIEDPANKLFEKVDLISIKRQPDGEEGPSPYPYRATLRVLPAKDNPFLLVQKGRQ